MNIRSLIIGTVCIICLCSTSLIFAEDTTIFGSRFKEGKGVELSEITKNSIGVTTSEFDDSSSFIPKTAVFTTIEGQFVYVVNGKHYLRTQIETEEESKDSVKVSSGLYAGDQLVTGAVNYLWYAELQAIRGGVSCADGH